MPTTTATPENPMVFNNTRTAAEASFVETFCLPVLRQSQNEDGGWGFHPKCESRVEATCWASLALAGTASPETSSDPVARSVRFLLAAQLPDGSWPASPEEKIGCWVTSLACWALLHKRDSGEAATAIRNGLDWLCRDWPRASTLMQRFLRRISSARRISKQNESYSGWGWTPRTASWVEPTSCALLVLSLAPAELLPPAAMRRRELAEAMLYDRMCPGGGWNSGNPMVYGVAGESLAAPTVWALLALRNYPNRIENTQSLDWLEQNLLRIQGPGSFVLARLCFDAYGRQWPPELPSFRKLYEQNEFLESVPVMAWSCLAANGDRSWLEATQRARD